MDTKELINIIKIDYNVRKYRNISYKIYSKHIFIHAKQPINNVLLVYKDYFEIVLSPIDDDMRFLRTLNNELILNQFYKVQYSDIQSEDHLRTIMKRLALYEYEILTGRKHVLAKPFDKII